MIQNKYSLDPLSKYLKEHPNAKNKELYVICDATTNSQKTGVRRKKGTLLKRKGDTKTPGLFQYLDAENLEKLVVDLINGETNVKESVVRIAVDYFTKVKSDKKEGTKQKLDMEGFLKIGNSLR